MTIPALGVPPTADPRVASTDRLTAIDMLRGVAVLLVLIHHLPFSGANSGGVSADLDTYPGTPWLLDALTLGRHGVLLFLVISGFAISIRWASVKDVRARVPFFAFWKRRLMRLYPPYLFALMLSLAAMYVAHSVLQPSPSGIGAAFGYPSSVDFFVDLALLLLLCQNLNNASMRVGNGPFWSLALEEQLYLLYFPMLWIRRRLGWMAVLVASASATLAWRIAGIALFDEPLVAWFRVGPAFWFAWVLGAIAAEVYVGTVVVPRAFRSPLVASVLILAAVVTDLPGGLLEGTSIAVIGRDFVYALGFAILLNAGCQWEATRQGAPLTSLSTRFLLYVGERSYGIYLIHNIAFIASKQAMVSVGFPPPLILVLRFLVGLFAGIAFYVVVERYFIVRSRAIRVPLLWPGETRNK